MTLHGLNAVSQAFLYLPRKKKKKKGVDMLINSNEYSAPTLTGRNFHVELYTSILGLGDSWLSTTHDLLLATDLPSHCVPRGYKGKETLAKLTYIQDNAHELPGFERHCGLWWLVEEIHSDTTKGLQVWNIARPEL